MHHTAFDLHNKASTQNEHDDQQPFPANRGPESLVLALVATGVTGLVVALQLSKMKKQRRTPSPPVAKVGMLQTIGEITGGRRMHEFLIEKFQKCGPIFRLSLPVTVVVVANAQDARMIYMDP